MSSALLEGQDFWKRGFSKTSALAVPLPPALPGFASAAVGRAAAMQLHVTSRDPETQLASYEISKLEYLF